jgi:hypothetical protein
MQFQSCELSRRKENGTQKARAVLTMAHPLLVLVLVLWDPAVIAPEVLISFPWIQTTTTAYKSPSVLITANTIPVNDTKPCVQAQVI